MRTCPHRLGAGYRWHPRLWIYIDCRRCLGTGETP